MLPEERIIGIVPSGDTDEMAVKVISAHIIGYLDLRTRILPAMESPVYAYDEKRFQYNAGIILKALDRQPEFNGFNKIIGVLNIDLFVPILTHVFGEAKEGGKFALVSLFRLGKASDGVIPQPPLVYERAAKVALHELGHLFNLLHCEDNSCLMHYSGGLKELDDTPLYFCRYCSVYFKDALKKP